MKIIGSYMGSGLFAFFLFVLPLILNFFNHGIDPFLIGMPAKVLIFGISLVFLAGLIFKWRIAVLCSGKFLVFLYPIIIALGAIPYGESQKSEFFENNIVAYSFMLFGIAYAAFISFMLRAVEKYLKTKNVPEGLFFNQFEKRQK